MSPDNPQYGNVGNRGDILKHAALLTAAGLMAERHALDRLNYLDTHAFLLQAPLVNDGWGAELAQMPGTAGAYSAYRLLQGPHTARGEYLCSSGLVLSAFGQVRLHLSEADGLTRERLANQLDDWKVAPAALLPRVESWADTGRAFQRGPLLALVDPFVMDDTTWQAVGAAVGRLWQPGDDGLLLAFDFSRGGAPIWPEPPPGWSGPIADVGQPPYYLAAYAAGAVAEGVLPVLAALGWGA